MRFAEGYLTVGSLDAAPVRIHWSAPVVAFVLGAGRIAPVFWFGFALVVLVHEIGHALMVRRVGGRVDAIEMTGWGGQCQWSGNPTRLEHALVAAGGLIAQIVVFIPITFLFLVLGRPQSAVMLELVQALVGVNIVLCLVNMLPFEPLDGASAWRVVPVALAWLREWRPFEPPPRRPPRRPVRRDRKRPSYLRVVRLDAELDRDLDRILRTPARTPPYDDESA